MKVFPAKKFDALKLVIDRNVNCRDEYDLESIMQQIRDAKRVLEPIHAIKNSNIVLKGNRRTSAVLELLKDPSLPADLKEAISELQVIFYDELTDDEISELVLDHGSQKPLTRCEVVKAAWRLVRQMKSERQIIDKMYHQLAEYTGKRHKAAEVQNLKGDERDEYLKTWLHGTVGNYIMATFAMGLFVQEQHLLTDAKLERKLTADEKERHVIDMTRGNVTLLSKAKNADKKEGGWDAEKGGEKFNALLQKLKDEFAGNGGTDTVKRPTAKQMEQAADGMKSIARVFYQHCAGTLSDADKKRIEEVDSEIHRSTKVRDALIAALDSVKDANVKGLLNSIVYKGEAEVQEALKTFCN